MRARTPFAQLSAVVMASLLAATATQAAEPAKAKAAPSTKAAAAGPSKAKDAQLDALFASAARSHAMLRVLVQKLPKGGDLHNHNGGSIYAEDWITWAAEAGGCFSKARQGLSQGPCVDPDVPLKGLADRDADLYSDIVDAISTRRFDQGVGDPTISGHRRFFRTFSRTGGGGGNAARTVAATLNQAGIDNTLYVELMSGPRGGGRAVSQASAAEPWDESKMAERLEKLKPLIAEGIPVAKSETDELDKAVRANLACDTPHPEPGCKVAIRYLLTMSRGNQPAPIFGQMAFAFALVQADPRFVGINIASPEDGPVSLRDYSLHMRMFAFFKKLYPKVPLTLHAGELALGLTPPRDMRFHIREAVEIAGAKRIGHGVSIAYEDNADELLARMARDKIDVEINLTSNDVILGVKGADHPLALYMAAGVPVSLSTDDEGVSRSDMSNEYFRAVAEQGLSYTQLRAISRNSLTYSFLAGPSIWDASGRKLAGPCDKVTATPAKACAAFLQTSDKAREQWRLEIALASYEAELRKITAAIPAANYPARVKN